MPKPAHFGCMAAISCRERAFFLSGAPSGMHQGDILPGIRSPPLVCSECASKAFHSKGAPSSVRDGSRKRFVQECGPSPVRECASKMLRLGPFGCTGERKMIIVLLCPRQLAFFGAVSSGHCCAVGFRVPVSPLTRMAAERAEHEQVRARMLLPPRRCRVWRAARPSHAAWR